MAEDNKVPVATLEYEPTAFEQTLINVRSRNLEGLVYDNLGRFFFHKTWLKA